MPSMECENSWVLNPSRLPVGTSRDAVVAVFIMFEKTCACSSEYTVRLSKEF